MKTLPHLAVAGTNSRSWHEVPTAAPRRGVRRKLKQRERRQGDGRVLGTEGREKSDGLSRNGWKYFLNCYF